MDNAMTLAIAVLQEKLAKLDEEYNRDRNELESAISNLKRLPLKMKTGSGKTEATLPLSPGSLEGCCITDSIQVFLALHGGPMPFDVLMRELDRGGVEMGDPAKPNRFAANVKTTIVNNRKRFRYDKRKDTVRLLIPSTQAQAQV